MTEPDRGPKHAPGSDGVTLRLLWPQWQGVGAMSITEPRDVRTGTLRRIDLAGKRVAIVTAAGRYAAYAVQFASPHETTVVVDVRTGWERYRVRTPRGSNAYGLAPDGRCGSSSAAAARAGS
jgi:hypothetical protein